MADWVGVPSTLSGELQSVQMEAGRGVGGGGFLQAVLKKGRTKEELRERIRSVFQDSGVDVWDCELVF